MARTKSKAIPKPAPRANTERVASCNARQRVAMHATRQLQPLLRRITAIARKTTDKESQSELLALSMRATCVNEAAMSAVCDDALDHDGIIAHWQTLNADDFGTGRPMGNGRE